LPRVRDGVSGRRAVRAADRSGEGRDRAPAAGRAAAPTLPLAELRRAAGPPATPGAGRDGRAPLPDQRSPTARPEERARAAPAGHAARVGGAAAAGAVEGGARGAAPPYARRPAAARA